MNPLFGISTTSSDSAPPSFCPIPQPPDRNRGEPQRRKERKERKGEGERFVFFLIPSLRPLGPLCLCGSPRFPFLSPSPPRRVRRCREPARSRSRRRR